MSSYSPFCPKIRSHCNEGLSGKNSIGSIRWPIPQKPHLDEKNIADIFYASRVKANFVPNFVAMATGVGQGKMQLAAFDGASPKTSYRRKNLAKISYASQVIVYCFLTHDGGVRQRCGCSVSCKLIRRMLVILADVSVDTAALIISTTV